MKEKNKIQYRKRYLPPITLMLLVIWFTCLININRLVVSTNSEDYVQVEATVTNIGVDSFFALIPKYTLDYDYKGSSYTSEVNDITKLLFITNIGDSQTVYVNTLSPKNCIIVYPFCDSLLNIINIGVLIFLAGMLANTIRWNIARRKQIKEFKKQRKLAKQRGEYKGFWQRFKEFFVTEKKEGSR